MTTYEVRRRNSHLELTDPLWFDLQEEVAWEQWYVNVPPNSWPCPTETTTQDHQRGNTAAQVRPRHVLHHILLAPSFSFDDRAFCRAPTIRQEYRSDAVKEPPHHAHAYFV